MDTDAPHVLVAHPVAVISVLVPLLARTIHEASAVPASDAVSHRREKNVLRTLGTELRIYEILDADKAKVMADLYPLSGAPFIDDTLYDIHERKEFKVRDFLVIRWGESNLLASPYFPRTGGMLVDWLKPD